MLSHLDPLVYVLAVWFNESTSTISFWPESIESAMLPVFYNTIVFIFAYKFLYLEERLCFS
jgi:hypothetical protein